MIKQPRVAHMGLRGRDILAYQRAFVKCGVRQRPNNGFFGTHTHWNVEEFQRRNHLKVDGILGPTTYSHLYRWFDGYGRWLLSHTRVPPIHHTTPRDLIIGAALTMYNHRPITYHEVRPYPPTIPLVIAEGSDCSGTAISAYKYAHNVFPYVPDPSGFGFDGYGSTYTMIDHGHWVPAPEPGDLAFYYPTFSHVGIYLGNGRVFSHGQPGDPRIISSYFATQFRRYL